MASRELIVRRSLSMSVVLSFLYVTAPVLAVVYTDGEFANWQFANLDRQGASSTAAQQTGGGNPAACLSVTTYPNNGYGHALSINNEVSWDPQMSGPLESIQMSVDSYVVPSNFWHGVNLLLVQDGKYYIERQGRENHSGTWQALEFGPYISADDFGELTESALLGGPLGSSPDFSVSGQPIAFGLQAVGCSDNLTRMELFDDWRLELTPEPGTLALLIFGGALIMRRR